MYILTKISEPGWEKTFPNKQLAYEELEPWICKMCKEEHFAEYNEWPSTIEDLLWTACGCEFMGEEE